MSPENVTGFGIPNNGRPVAALLNRLMGNGGRHLFFPAGTYLIEETLRVPAGTTLELHGSAVFRLADGAATTTNDYLLTNAHHDTGDADIIIRGGIFDGNQRGNPRPPGLLDAGYSGAMLHFCSVKNIRLESATLQNAEAYYARFTHAHGLHVENILFDSDLVRPNNDGIHLGGNCSGGVIRNLKSRSPGVTGDDMVALNADDALQRTEVHGMTNGDIRDILIENIKAPSCHTFVRLLCVWSTIRDVTIRGLRGGCQVAALNADGARGCRVQVFDEANPPYPDGVGMLENILAEDIHVYKTHDNDSALVNLQERARGLRVRDFHRDMSRDCGPGSPTLRMAHIQMHGGSLNGAALPALNTQVPNPAFESRAPTLDFTLNPA